jgi:uncharacterized membrane protein (DUF106 family)
VQIVEQLMQVKTVENQVLKPLDQWRDDLYGFWMVYTDIQIIDGVKMAIARHYGTDKEKLYDLYEMLQEATDEPTVGIVFNQKSNWMGGVFLVKPNR